MLLSFRRKMSWRRPGNGPCNERRHHPAWGTATLELNAVLALVARVHLLLNVVVEPGPAYGPEGAVDEAPHIP